MSKDEDPEYTSEYITAKLRGATKKALGFVQHATFEVGPSPDDLWAFRLTVHPFRTQAEAMRGVAKMKALLRKKGFKFTGDPK